MLLGHGFNKNSSEQSELRHFAFHILHFQLILLGAMSPIRSE